VDFCSLVRCHWRIMPCEGKKLASPLVVGVEARNIRRAGEGNIGKARLACRYGDISACDLLSY
jgi:hypothetical protein